MWRLIPLGAKKRHLPHDDHAYVLSMDELRRRVQVLGDRYFILMEFAIRPGAKLSGGKKIYVGKGPRHEVSKFIRYLSYEELRESSKILLRETVEKIVVEGEAFFVKFFNESVPLTPRLHQLELLPGVGKRLMEKILEERAKKKFESYDDVKTRAGLKNPAESICGRVMEELMQDQSVYLFVAPKKLFERDRKLLGY